jgi:hypothetical protein
MYNTRGVLMSNFNIKVFYLATDAQVNGLRNIYIKIDVKSRNM